MTTTPQTLDAFHVEQLAAVQQRSHVAAPPDTITVAVLDEDILLGTRRNPSWCPIARALRRTLTLQGLPPDAVCVGSAAHWGYATVSVEFTSPAIVQYRFRPEGFIYLFDAGEPVEPRTFTLVPL